MRRLLGALAAALTLASLAPDAAAQPTLWQRARDPALARSEELADRLERLLRIGNEADRGGRTARDFALAAVAAADLAGASRLPGARLNCLLGEVFLQAGFPRRTRDLLAQVVDDLPPGPLAAECWYSYGLSLAYLEDSKREIEAFTRALSYAHAAHFRAHLLYNRGEAQMALGRLPEAMDDYKKAIALARDPDLQALCYYGLAVALDRNGDLPSAYLALDSAHVLSPPFTAFPGRDVLDSPSVFFVPAYDEDYYRALSRMAAARSAKSEAARREHYARALDHWTAFIAEAEQAQSPWVENARLHASACRRELGLR